MNDRADYRTARVRGTVAELIEALSQYPPDTEVVVGDMYEGTWRLVAEVRPPYGHGERRIERTVAISSGEVVE